MSAAKAEKKLGEIKKIIDNKEAFEEEFKML